MNTHERYIVLEINNQPGIVFETTTRQEIALCSSLEDASLIAGHMNKLLSRAKIAEEKP